MTQEAAKAALAGLRVLEIADEKGVYCGKLLADLGADVVKIERPGGDPTRNVAPFLHDEPCPERSLYFYLYNTNKKGITINLECADGQALFKGLARNADVVIETNPPGYLANLGLDFAVLSETNPRLVMTSITPFGQTGPYRDYQSSDMTACAMGGVMYVSGEPERPPVRSAGLLSYHMVSSMASVATMIAVLYRDISGLGQHLDVSMHEAIAAQLESYSIYFLYEDLIASRHGAGIPYLVPCRLYPCKDGYFHLITSQLYQWKALVEWTGSEILADPRYLEGQARVADRAIIDRAIEEWAKDFTKMELFHEGQRRRIPVGPSRTTKEVVEDPQLQARNFFVDVEHRDVGRLKYPGAPYIFGETPWQVRHPAPKIGEHNGEILGNELGLSQGELIALKAAGVI